MATEKKRKTNSIVVKGEDNAFDISLYLSEKYVREKSVVEFFNDDTLIKIKSNGKIVGTMEFIDDSITFSGKEFVKIVEDIIALPKKELSVSIFENSVFCSNNFSSFLSKLSFFKNNAGLFEKYDELFKTHGINNVKVEKANNGIVPFSYGKITLIQGIKDSSSNRKSISKSDFEEWVKKNYSINPQYAVTIETFSPVNGFDEYEEIKIGNKIVGEYYRKYNVVYSYFNLFSQFSNYCFDTEPNDLIIGFVKAFKKLKPKEQDEKFLMAINIMNAANVSSATNISRLEIDIKDITKSVSNYETAISNHIRELRDKSETLYHFKSLLKKAPEEFITVVTDTLKLPFIDNIYMDEGKIHIKVKPFFLKIPNYKRNIGGEKIFGDRFVYMDDINFIIGTDIRLVESSVRRITHPHFSTSPCFGSGEGREKIFNALNSMNLPDLSKMLWFWANTFIPDSAYISSRDFYDYCLKEGIPVFDNKGEKVMLNDEARIKTGEQTKLEPDDKYEANIKKYADVVFKKK